MRTEALSDTGGVQKRGETTCFRLFLGSVSRGWVTTAAGVSASVRGRQMCSVLHLAGAQGEHAVHGRTKGNHDRSQAQTVALKRKKFQMRSLKCALAGVAGRFVVFWWQRATLRSEPDLCSFRKSGNLLSAGSGAALKGNYENA